MQAEIFDWYRILELWPGAPLDEVKQAYLDLIKVWHPDRFEHEAARLKLKAEEKIKQLNSAYTQLADHLQQVEYAESGVAAPAPSRDTGPVRIKPQYFGGFWGYIDERGKIAIEPKFLSAEPFHLGMACVKAPVVDAAASLKPSTGLKNAPGRYGFIVPTGEWAIQPRFERAHGFKEGLAAVRVHRRWGYIDTTGAFAIVPVFDDARSFRQSLAAAKVNALWGFIDLGGEFVISPRFEQVDDFKDGWAWVKLPGGRERVKINPAGELYSR